MTKTWFPLEASMKFDISEEWLMRMAAAEDGANICIGSPSPISFEDAGGMRTVPQGRYRYVRYDRRNGTVKVGSAMFLLDPKTFEVTSDAGALMPFVGVSLIATKWRWYERLMWRLTGKQELGRWSPVRFFFVQESGFVSQVV